MDPRIWSEKHHNAKLIKSAARFTVLETWGVEKLLQDHSNIEKYTVTVLNIQQSHLEAGAVPMATKLPRALYHSWGHGTDKAGITLISKPFVLFAIIDAFECMTQRRNFITNYIWVFLEPYHIINGNIEIISRSSKIDATSIFMVHLIFQSIGSILSALKLLRVSWLGYYLIFQRSIKFPKFDNSFWCQQADHPPTFHS